MAISTAEVEVLSQGTRKIDDIEVLRAIAIMMTLVGHSAELLYWGNPLVIWCAVSLWGGVDLFFCISGFVIARSLICDAPKQGGVQSFLAFAIPFYIRRIFRIWPAAFFWLAIPLLFTAFLNKSGAFGTPGVILKDALSAVMQVANFHFLQCIGYKDGSCHNLLGIYWSLSLEEQFYILLPVLLFLVPRPYVIYSLSAGVMCQFFLERPTWSTFWAIRSDAIMLGVLIAYVPSVVIRMIEPNFLRHRGKATLTFVIGVMLLALIPSDKSSVTLSSADNSFVWFSTGLLALVCGLLVLIASFGEGYSFPQGNLRRLLLYIGSRSYALYLSHNAMFFLTREIFFRAYPGVTFDDSFALQFIGVAGVLSFLSAELTYRFIEVPLRCLGRRKATVYRQKYPLDAVA